MKIRKPDIMDTSLFTANKESIAWLSIISIGLLILMKYIASFMTGSVGIRADAFHSTIDFVGAIVALICIRISSRPADNQHSFGHGKAENVAGIFVAGLIFIAAGTITYEAIHRLISDSTMEMVTAGIYITCVAVAINLAVSGYILRVAKTTDSIALEATGRDMLADSYSSIAVLIGLVLVSLTGINELDAIVALLVAGIIAKTAFFTFKRALQGIMDTRLSEDDEKIIESCIADYEKNIAGFQHLRTRKSGSERFIDFQLIVPKHLSVEKAHSICDELEAQIADKLDPIYTTIHVEPCTFVCDNCPVLCRDLNPHS